MEAAYSFDLEGYAKRIGFVGTFEPTLAVLEQIQLRHVCSIPFENLSVLQKVPIDLQPSALEQKLIHEARGGYCFEQNGLMLRVLRQIGFEVRPISARVRIERPRDFMPPRTHLVLVVRIEGEDWIFDAGIGSLSLTSPIRLKADCEQPTHHETRRITNEHGRFFHQALVGDAWKDAYEFTGEEMFAIDCEVGNWFTSTNPNSKFSQTLTVSRASSNGERLGILNDRFVRRCGGEILEEVHLTSADHLLDVLAENFSLVFPPGTRFGVAPKPWPTE
ncbi:MAG: arylamine N-acetyltransferase [Fimbriimonadaceae bacterium]